MFDGLRRWGGRLLVQDGVNSSVPRPRGKVHQDNEPDSEPDNEPDNEPENEPENEQEGRPEDQEKNWQENRLLTAILVGIERLQSPGGREDLLRQVGGGLGDVTPHSQVARDHLRFIVEAARGTEKKLKSLRGALFYIEPDDLGSVWFDLAVTVLTVEETLPRPQMIDLLYELRDCSPEFGGRVVARYLSQRRALKRPLGDGSPDLTLPEVLKHLVDARRTPTDPETPRADLLRFLELLLVEAGGPETESRLVRALGPILRTRTRTGSDPDRVVDPVGGVAQRQIIIQIRVEEEGAPSDLPYHRRTYSLRGFYYERIGDDRPVFQGSRAAPDVFTGDELDRRGREFIASWPEPMDAARGVSKRVEFLLPHSLLAYPAEAWPTSAGYPLRYSCQVVVRSLPRYQDSALHDEWIRRWDALDRGCPRGDALKRIGWMGPGAGTELFDGANSPALPLSWPDGSYPPLLLTGLADVEDWLLRNPDLACLGLVAPYGDQHPLLREAVCDALLAYGIPAIVWRRYPGDPGPLLDALRETEPPALLADLPHSVHQARRRNWRDKSDVRRQIILLWDDPKCVHRDQDHQLSGTRGAGEGVS